MFVSKKRETIGGGGLPGIQGPNASHIRDLKLKQRKWQGPSCRLRTILLFLYVNHSSAMDAKLTLKLDGVLIKRAKVYARRKNTSPSQFPSAAIPSIWPWHLTLVILRTRFNKCLENDCAPSLLNAQ